MLKKYIVRNNELGQSLLDVRPTNETVELLCSSVVYEHEVHSEGQIDATTESEMVDIVPMPPRVQKQTNKYVQVNLKLTNSQKLEIFQILSKFSEIFTDVPKQTNAIECNLHLTTNEPIRSKPYPIPQAVRETVRSEIKDMLSMGIIRPSTSSYASPVVMVRKKDNSVRFCVDYRKLNRIIMLDPEPMPNPDELFTELSKDKYFSKIDMTKGYWQIPMAPEAIPKTAFVTPDGHYEFNYVPFGLVVAPAVFTHMMRSLFLDVKNVASYIDDILIHTVTWPDSIFYIPLIVF